MEECGGHAGFYINEMFLGSKDEYSVTLNKGEFISSVSGEGIYKPGTEVIVTCTPYDTVEESWSIEGDGTYEGEKRTKTLYTYVVEGWNYPSEISGTLLDDNKTFKFIMPENDVNITVNAIRSATTMSQTWSVLDTEVNENAIRDPLNFRYRDTRDWYNLSFNVGFDGHPKGWSSVGFTYDGHTLTDWGTVSNGNYCIEIDGEQYWHQGGNSYSVAVPGVVASVYGWVDD